MRPAISPNGKYLTFHALGKGCPIRLPGRRIRRFASGQQAVSHPAQRADSSGAATTIPARRQRTVAHVAALASRWMPADQRSILGHGAAVERQRRNTWYAARRRSAMAVLWMSRSWGHFVPHRFAIDAKSGRQSASWTRRRRRFLAFDEEARRIVLRADNGDVVILRKTDAAAAQWTEQQRIKIPASGLRGLATSPADPSHFVGIHQTPTESPDLWLLDVKAAASAVDRDQPRAAGTNCLAKWK